VIVLQYVGKGQLAETAKVPPPMTLENKLPGTEHIRVKAEFVRF
jgi:hypothetical protein